MAGVAPRLTRYAWLSIAASLSTLALKAAAWALTSSVGLLSDALESLVNVGAAVMLLSMLRIATRPADEDHAYGHSKAEYFASGFEGLLVVVASGGIAYAATSRLLHPRALEHASLGLGLTILASGVNFVVARVLMRAGRKYNSIALEADAQHLLTDVWTSAGVILGVGLVVLTGWLVLDPLIAFAVAGNILFIGWRLLKESILGLMDAAWPKDERALLERVLADYRLRVVPCSRARSLDGAAGTRSAGGNRAAHHGARGQPDRRHSPRARRGSGFISRPAARARATRRLSLRSARRPPP
jgi:cation diffusion facilitator family transporter